MTSHSKGANKGPNKGHSRGRKSGAKSGARSAARSGARKRRRQQRPQQARPASKGMATRDEVSSGGLVVSGLAEAVDAQGNVDLAQIYVALIGRLDRRGRLLWSMPKGHVEGDEPKDLTAQREVWEETGIYGEVFASLGVIDYWFVSDGVRIHKTVHHHLLRYVDGILNDEDPEVTEVAWIPVSELIEHLAYADERRLARIAHDLLPDFARQEKAAGKVTPR
ncbi:NUDIX hydrolase [Corynebacterium lizhenjunii]|uniref:NUDIX hydrolase n=1 Tax=Corynebacterium lizhenjunii TaxID=2709394 RepID=A0A7T0KE62_9CORY|nr:NUDIX hydrolase [Corynebacterium lizhenjunii]QPK79148.1 NUDIX hydrolase [Corynebacterium lizhenjunii]